MRKYNSSMWAQESETILSEEKTRKFTKLQWQTIIDASERIATRSSNITIQDDGPYTVEKICEYVRQYVEAYEKSPVIVVDYLQIMDSSNEKLGNEKQLTDYNIKMLKKMSTQYNIPVIIISSMNRSSYEKQASLQSLKESGGIEYTCDTVMVLQYKGVGAKDFDVNYAQKCNPRELELCVLKQRYGSVGAKIELLFYAQYNFFSERKINVDNKEYDYMY